MSEKTFVNEFFKKENSSFFVFKIAKEKFGSLEAIISSLLFMFSYGIMFNSVFSLGVMTSAMFLVIGIYFLFSKNSYYYFIVIL